MPSVLVDTGVWYSFFDPTDRHDDRDTVETLANLIEPMNVIVPWPVTYETVRTRLARRREAMLAFERQLKSTRTVFIDDAQYREEALHECFESARLGRPLSLLDCLLRSLISDSNTKIDYLATYNNGDFSDVCARHRVHLLPG